MTYQQETEDIFRRAGGLIRDSHVVYASYKHGDTYINKDAVYPSTLSMHRIAGMLCERIGELARMGDAETGRVDIDIVVAPAIGGIILGQWVTHLIPHFVRHKRVQFVFAEKRGYGTYAFTRGYDKLILGKRILIVEDILTTGGTVRKIVDLVRVHGGTVVGVAAICNRGGVTADDLGIGPDPARALPMPFFTSLATIPFEAWDAADCPLCAAGVPINVEVGKGAEFLADKGKTWTQRMAERAILRLQKLLPNPFDT